MSTDMHVYVPSRGRADMMNRRKMTLDFIKNATFVVPHGEVEAYQKAVAKKGDFEVIGCPSPNLSEKRHWIGQHAEENGHKKFVMVDDDLDFFVRKSPEGYQLRAITEAEAAPMLEWIDRALDEHVHAAVSSRQGNNVKPRGDVNQLVALNERASRFLAYQTAAFLSVEHGRVICQQDFDITLQLLRKGQSNIVTFWWAQGQPSMGLEGGCSAYRTVELHNDSARKLHELHAPFVKLREKHGKHGPMKDRLEVTVQWKEAFDSATKVKSGRVEQPLSTARAKRRTTVETLHCSECGAAAKASCDCGVSYLPAGEFAAKVVAENPEMSNGAIAEKCGVSIATVRRARNSTSSNELVEKTIGRDGRKRKARRDGGAAKGGDLTPDAQQKEFTGWLTDQRELSRKAVSGALRVDSPEADWPVVDPSVLEQAGRQIRKGGEAQIRTGDFLLARAAELRAETGEVRTAADEEEVPDEKPAKRKRRAKQNDAEVSNGAAAG
jgi:hypothetical protein